MSTTQMTLREYAKMNGASWKSELTRMHREGNFKGATLQELMNLGPDKIHGPVAVPKDYVANTAASMHVRARTLSRVQAQTGRTIPELKGSMKAALKQSGGMSPDAAFQKYWAGEPAQSHEQQAPEPTDTSRKPSKMRAAAAGLIYAAVDNEMSKSLDPLESQAEEMGISPQALQAVVSASGRPREEFRSSIATAIARYPNLDRNVAFTKFWREGLTLKKQLAEKKKSGSMSEQEEMSYKKKLGAWGI